MNKGTAHKIELIEVKEDQKYNEDDIKLAQTTILSRLHGYFQKLIFYQKLEDISYAETLQILEKISKKQCNVTNAYTNFEIMIEKEIGINHNNKPLFDNQYHKFKQKYGSLFIDQIDGKCYFENDSISSLDSIDCDNL
eukprot:377845_1